MATWQTGLAYPQDNLASKGYAVFPRLGGNSNDSPPKFVLLGRNDKAGKLRILRTQLTDNPCRDIAVTRTCFQGLQAGNGAAEQDGVAVRYRAAGFWRRAWHRPLDTIVAILGLLGVIGTAVAGLVGGIAKPQIPVWLLFGISVAVMLAGAARFLRDLRKSDPS
jgi:hypothetical protein